MPNSYSNRNGILAAGNWILDQVKLIDRFPAEQSLVNILEEYTSNGGSAYNILIDLVHLRSTFPLEAIGLVGNDTGGTKIINECNAMGIDTRQLRQISGKATSYTTVMSVKNTGKRTFFHCRGANALLDQEHFNFSNSKAKIFHLGYLLLLDRLDEIGPDGRTNASHVLEEAKKQGLETSIDLVSEAAARFGNIVPCSLPYVDYLFLNEYEAAMLSGINLSDEENDSVNVNNCRDASTLIFTMGVCKWIIIHFPDGVYAMHRSGEEIFQPGINLPPEKVVGGNGAGDALAAGILFGIHENWNMGQSLKLGVSAAASSLFSVSCSDAVLPIDECIDLINTYGLRTNKLPEACNM